MSARRGLRSIVLLLGVVGCASLGTPRVEPFRISSVADQGDATRRASTRLVLRGLDADREGHLPRGRSLYERALQVDPTNPHAFLALARQAAQRGAGDEARAFAEQAETLLDLERAPEGALLHARALQATARTRRGGRDAAAWLAHAERVAPEVWGDGRLDAHELR